MMGRKASPDWRASLIQPGELLTLEIIQKMQSRLMQYRNW